MAILRHSNITVTMNIYIDVPAAVTRDALIGTQLGGAELLYQPAVPAQKSRFRWWNGALTNVGDTGIEPVTSSV